MRSCRGARQEEQDGGAGRRAASQTALTPAWPDRSANLPPVYVACAYRFVFRTRALSRKWPRDSTQKLFSEAMKEVRARGQN